MTLELDVFRLKPFSGLLLTPPRLAMVLTLIASLGLSLLPQANAYVWSFQQPPQQCGNLSIAISGNDGQPPYRVLIIPFGPSPLANNIEARRIMDVPFPSGQSRVQFQLKYPANSQFVAVVSIVVDFSSSFVVLFFFFSSSAVYSLFLRRLFFPLIRILGRLRHRPRPTLAVPSSHSTLVTPIRQLHPNLPHRVFPCT